MDANRLECERLIYKIMRILDDSGKNEEFWINEFAAMSDEQFKKYITGHYPLYFQTGAFNEPSIKQITDALNEINVPLLESIYMPYKYKDPEIEAGVLKKTNDRQRYIIFQQFFVNMSNPVQFSRYMEIYF